MAIVLFLLIIGVVILVHELGHYTAARCCGVSVNEFALGLGPVLLSKEGHVQACGKRTVYSIRLLPIGGFCDLKSDEESSEFSIDSKKPLQRLWIVVNGAVFNVFFAIVVIFLVIFFSAFPTSTIRAVQEDSPAYTAGVQAGDMIVMVNDRRVRIFEDFMLYVALNGVQPLNMEVEREGGLYTFYITPDITSSGQAFIGVSSSIKAKNTHGLEHVGQAMVVDVLVNTVHKVRLLAETPIFVISDFVQGKPIPVGIDFVGPIGMASQVAEIYDDVSSHGMLSVLVTMANLTGMLSVTIGVMNLLPIPALDGARSVFIMLEMIRKKQLARELENAIHRVGMMVLLTLTVFVSVREVLNLF